ncbi:MAG: hypothetical protein GQ533_09110 [Methanosarcinaceae archaeon]|nr:hypothetical protein [Methanosarcinaceae archaeon]
MDKILLFGILFFAFMTLYNLKIAIKQKKDFIPAIIGFLFTLMVLLVYFKQIFYGLMCITVIAVISIIYLVKVMLKPSELSKSWGEKISKELEKKGCKDPLKLKDFLRWRGFAKIAVKYGAKKAAFFYASFIVASISLLLLFFCVIFPEVAQISLGEWISFIAIGFIFLYYVSSKVFEKALKDVNTNE